MKEMIFMPGAHARRQIPPERLISRDDLTAFIKTQLGGRLETGMDLNRGVYMADSEYYCSSVADARAIIENSQVRGMTSSIGGMQSQRFDCDDFSLLMKARFSYAVYKNAGSPNFPHCFGIVWGMLPFPIPHSVNWMVTADENGDKSFYFVEPQTYEIRSLADERCKRYRNIYFMLV